MLGQLVPCGGGRPIPLLRSKLLVGRKNFCDIPFCFPPVSSRHCELELKDGYWHVRDLDSKNGIRVNGMECESQQLLPGDILAVAGFRFRIDYSPAEPGSPEGVPPAIQAPVRGRDMKESVIGHGQQTCTRGSGLGELVPCGGGVPIPLHQTKLVVGRNQACDVVLESTMVSARHCELEWLDGSWLVRDLGSRNGIRVDDIPCVSKKLDSGSVLTIAGQRFLLIYSSPGAATNVRSTSPLFAQSLAGPAGWEHWGEERGEPEKRKPVAGEENSHVGRHRDNPT